MSARTVLVLGGARSGKSWHAEALAEGWHGRKVYIATAEARDAEMAERIAHHRERRQSGGWATVEAPLELESALRAEDRPDAFVLVDCVTLWVTNLLLGERDVSAAVESLCLALQAPQSRIVLVSNEVGLGIVPDNALARRFRDVAGLANQRIASSVEEVVFMAAGLSMKLK